MIENINLKWIVVGAKESQKQIDMYYTYLNHHLDLYSKALNEGNIAELCFHEDSLNQLRSILMELEYFNLGGNSSGQSTKSKSRPRKSKAQNSCSKKALS